MKPFNVAIQFLMHDGLQVLPLLFTNSIDLKTKIASFQNDMCLDLNVTAERRDFPFFGQTELPFTESNAISINKAKLLVPMAFCPSLILSGAKQIQWRV